MTKFKILLCCMASLALTTGFADVQPTSPPANPFTNAPAGMNPILLMFESMPTVPLNQAHWFFDTGAYNGPSLNPQTGAVGTTLQNYIDLDLYPTTNAPVVVGAELRNVINHIDYIGLDLDYQRVISPTMLLGLTIRAGFDQDNRIPQIAGELHGRWQPLGPGTPYTDVAAGYAEEIGIAGHAKSGGSLCGHLGITIPLP